MSTSPQSDDLDTDLVETRFESSRSLPRERAVESEERRGLAQAPPDLDDAEEPEAETATPPADVDDATPAEEADNLAGDEGNNEESPTGSTDTLGDEPATETSATPTEDAPAGDEGHQPDEAPQADPDDTSGAPAEGSNDPEVTATALPEEETAADATTKPEPKAEETSATTEHTQDQALLDDDDLVSFQSLEEDSEDSPTFLAMTTSTADEPEPITATSQFQQGQDGYAGVVDTFLYEGQSRANRSSQKTLTVDSEERRGEMQALVRFNDIFGDTTGQIPLGATILSATLELQTTTSGDGARLHRMLQSWSDGDTWDSLQNGIQADDVEALAQADLETGAISAGTTRLDVTTSLQAWADGQENLGWAFLPLGPNGWSFDSAEGSTPPRLVVDYSYTPVTPANNPPLTQDDTASTVEGSAVQIAVLENDSDPDGDPLTVGAVTQPSHGSVTINADGTLSYTPDEGFVGTDSFTYQASDGDLLSDSATVQVTVEQAEPVNAPPLAQDDTASTVEGSVVQIAVLENDSDPDGDPLTVGAVTQPSHGSVTINSDGTLTYTPDEGFVGTDSFTYQASDGDLLSDPATVQVTVEQAEPVNAPPLAQDDTASTVEGSVVQIAVLENDSDPDGDPLTVGAVTQPSHGSVTINADGTLTYTPNEGFVGTDSFTYQASDGDLLSDPATVQVTVEQAEPVNAPPLAQDDTASTVEGSVVQIAVLENDSDPDGDPLTVGAVTQPSHGSVTINPDGTLTYTPDEGFVGTDSFTYQASDGDLLSDPATVQVTVEQAEEPPPGTTTVQFQHGSDGYFGVVDTYLHQAQPDASRASSSTLVVDSVDSGGEVQTLLRFDDLFGSASGKIPLGATILSATLVVQTTSKGDGATLHRMLQPWSDGATWNSLENGIQADGIEAMIPIDLDTGFIPAGTTQLDVTTSLQAWADGQANHGWAFLPQGPDGWDFHSAEGSTPPTLIVEYSTADQGPANNAPLANDDTASTDQGLAVQIAVLENDSDPDGDPLTVGAVTRPNNGSVTVNADGTLTYTPDFGFIGSDSFTYRAYDGRLLSDPATVNVAVMEGDGPPPLPLETSYIATAFGTNDRRNFEHTNATKSFFHDGEWWAVLPEQTGWHVYRFDGSLPDPGTLGGWVKSSPTMLTSGRRADIAWDDATDTLYVLNFGPTESSPRLFQLGYSAQTGTFEIEIDVQLAGSGGKLTGAEWQRNTEMSLGLDQDGSPVVALIGPSAAGGEKGLKLAYPTSDSLATWSTTTVDPGPSTTSGSNGDNKVDFVAFDLDGVAHVGLVYGDDATGLWKFAYQPTPSSPSGYGSGWTIDTITDQVVLDNHLAALWDGSAILMTMKDDQNALWAIRGMPGSWETPVLVHSATHSGSRPTLAYDEDNETLFVFYQENTNRPYGDIYFKASNAGELSFDPSDPGTLFVTSPRDGDYMSDPQMPTHAVGEATDGMFFVFARNSEAKEIWYNDFQLADDWLIA
ncbi:Ig-like domain-containing protein [Halomonas sp. 3H]|uniref:Ig-like domain-containing protein n=1 Tax=Halomonas sp. 3H TaxID=2952527 RepID=UPI0020B90005|nr:Ig-like domain-containing protein [Halomonas sp. 3H]